MKVGDYVRSSWGTISKIIEYTPYEDDECFGIKLEDGTNTFYKHQWQFDNNYKVSSNIIDLIQEGDYVNGGRVVAHRYEPHRLFVENIYVGGKGQQTMENYSWELTTKYVADEPDAIQTILTKEQFESMEYRIGE